MLQLMIAFTAGVLFSEFVVPFILDMVTLKRRRTRRKLINQLTTEGWLIQSPSDITNDTTQPVRDPNRPRSPADADAITQQPTW